MSMTIKIPAGLQLDGSQESIVCECDHLLEDHKSRCDGGDGGCLCDARAADLAYLAVHVVLDDLIDRLESAGGESE